MHVGRWGYESVRDVSAVLPHQILPKAQLAAVHPCPPSHCTYSTPARFASVFAAKFSVSTPEWRWSPAMRAALTHACADFIASNVRPLLLPVSRTPAVTPGVGAWSPYPHGHVLEHSSPSPRVGSVWLDIHTHTKDFMHCLTPWVQLDAPLFFAHAVGEVRCTLYLYTHLVA